MIAQTQKLTNMKEMIILPDGSVVYMIVSDYEFDAAVQKYRAEIVYKGITHVMHFYNNFWA